MKKPEYILMDLFTILFLISLLKSKLFLSLAAVIIILGGLVFTRSLKFLKTMKAVSPFLILMAIPYLVEWFLGHGFYIPEYMRAIMAKVALSAMVLGIISEKYSQLVLVDGIVDLGIHPVLSRIIALTFRYFYMINQDVTIGRKALEARGVLNNRGLSNLTIWGEWMGGFFLKSSQHGDQVYQAMLARGFTGESKGNFFKRKDLVRRLIFSVFILILILVIEGRFLIGH